MLIKTAKKIVEPKPQDVLNAAKNYFIAKRIMAAEKCNGISLNCLGLVQTRRIPCPPCMAWQRLNNEGSVGGVRVRLERRHLHAALRAVVPAAGLPAGPGAEHCQRHLHGAHCTSATKLHGFDKPALPMILRSHSESEIGVSPQVLFPAGKRSP